MVIEEIEEGSQVYLEALELRYQLFFKEFDLPRSVTADKLEADSIHVALSENGVLLAYGRLSPLESETFRVSQIVVSENHRRKGHASAIVSELVKCAERRAARKVVLNSQLSVIPLYEKFGFREIGDIYTVELTGVKHQKMLLEIKG